ncbi:hypothetical protein [Dongia sp. agr-C8]
MIARFRHHRFAIGLIAAYALLLSTLLPAFAAVADPLQAMLEAHLCGPSGSQNDEAPASPAEHQQKCQLCGPSCAMGGHAPVATLADGGITVAPPATSMAMPQGPGDADPAPLSLYPSDLFSQGPPQAA